MGTRSGPRLVRRGRIWHCWVPRPEGGTRRVTTNCTDKDAARERARELERRAASPAHQTAHQTTIRQLADRFLASRKRAGRAAGTLHHYTVKCSHIVRLLPNPMHLTHNLVERYADTREEEGAAKTTVKKELRALGAMLRYGKRSGIWLGDIAAIIPEYADTYEPRTRALTFLEAKALLTELEKPSNTQPAEAAKNRAAFVAFVLATGARLGEALRAQRDDISKGSIRIRGSKTKLAKREVPISGFFADLAVYVLACIGDRKGRMFDTWSNPTRDLDVACKHAGIDRVTPNDLRRTYASWLIGDLSMDLDTARRMLGHSSTRMLERVYGQVSQAEMASRLRVRLLDQRGRKGSSRLLLPAKPTPGNKPK